MNETVYICPLCDIQIIQTGDHFPIELVRIAQEIETEIRSHLAESHPFRLWLWDLLHWKWLIRGVRAA